MHTFVGEHPTCGRVAPSAQQCSAGAASPQRHSATSKDIFRWKGAATSLLTSSGGGGGGRCAAKHPPPSGDQDSPQQRGTRPTSQQCRGPETVLDSNLSPTAPCCSVRPATHQTGRTPHSLDGGRVPSPGHGRAERRIWPPGTCRLLTSTRTEVVGAWEAEGGGGRWREKQN